MTQPQPTEPAYITAPQVRLAAERLARTAVARVQDPSGRVRVEDYLTVLAAMAGESALVVGIAPTEIETADLAPGSAVFGPQINEILSGDGSEIAEVPADSVVGILVRELVPATVPISYFDQLERLYKLVVSNVGTEPWGNVPLSVGDDHRPTILPIQVAFEMRGVVDQALQLAELPPELRHVPCALALAIGIRQVAGAIELPVAVNLALEVTFGMAKMAPMSKAAYERVASAQH